MSLHLYYGVVMMLHKHVDDNVTLGKSMQFSLLYFADVLQQYSLTSVFFSVQCLDKFLLVENSLDFTSNTHFRRYSNVLYWHHNFFVSLYLILNKIFLRLHVSYNFWNLYASLQVWIIYVSCIHAIMSKSVDKEFLLKIILLMWNESCNYLLKYICNILPCRLEL